MLVFLLPDSIDHFLFTADGQALMKFLEKEATSHNKFRESKTKNPKQDLERMEAMIAKQEGKEEPLDAKNDKLLHEQLTQLMGDKSHSEKELTKLKQHNGDGKDKVAVLGTSDQASSIPNAEVEVLDNSILKYIQTSKRFQNYLKDKGILPATSTNNSTTEGSTRGMGSDTEMFERPLADQFEEIELQKEILNLRERQLRNRDRNKFLKKSEQESMARAMARARTNHLLHLTNPEREKASETSPRDETATEMQDFQKFSQDFKLLKSRKLSKKKNSTGTKNVSKKSEEKTPVNAVTKTVDDGSGEGSGTIEEKQQTKVTELNLTTQEKPNEPSTGSEKSVVHNYVTKEKDVPETEDSLPKKAEETPSPTVASSKSEDFSNDNTGFSKRTSQVSPVSTIDKSNIKKKNESIFTESSKESVTAVHEERLTLPINNPKPEATLTLTPHADFIPSERIIRPHHGNTPSSKVKEITPERRHNLPTDNKNALHMSPAHRRQFSILEPPPSIPNTVKKQEESLERAFIKPNTIVQPSQVADGPTNLLLKHKIIPSPNEQVKNSLQMFVHSVAPKGLQRFIRPSSVHASDVRAVKKGFGKLPQKPKEYLLKELQRDISLLDKKSKLMQLKNKTVSENTAGVITPKRNATATHILAPSKLQPTGKRSQIQIEDVFNMLKTEDQP